MISEKMLLFFNGKLFWKTMSLVQVLHRPGHSFGGKKWKKMKKLLRIGKICSVSQDLIIKQKHWNWEEWLSIKVVGKYYFDTIEDELSRLQSQVVVNFLTWKDSNIRTTWKFFFQRTCQQNLVNIVGIKKRIVIG